MNFARAICVGSYDVAMVLIPRAPVSIAPGKSIVLKRPLSNKKPWLPWLMNLANQMTENSPDFTRAGPVTHLHETH